MRKRLELAAVTSGHFVNDLYAAFLTPLLPMLVAKFDMSLAMAGLLSAVYATTSSMVQPLVGHLADTSGSRAFIVLGPVITATAMCMIGLAGSQALLVALLIIGGIGSGMFHPQGAAMAGSIDQARKGFMLSAFTTAGEIGYALGPLVVLSVVSTLGIRHTYVTVLPGILVSLFIYRFAPRVHAGRPGAKACGSRGRGFSHGGRSSSGRRNGNGDGDDTGNGKGGAMHSRPNNGGAPSRRRGEWVPVGALAMLWVIAAVRLSVSMSFTTFLPIYLKEMGLPLMAYGSVASMFMFAGTVGIMVAGPIADRVGPFKLMVVALLAPIPLLLGFLHMKGLVSYALLAAAGVILYAPMPVITMTAQNLAPARAGTVSAFMMGVAWGAGSLGVAGVGVIADGLGIRMALTLLLGTLVVAAALTYALEMRVRHVPSLLATREPICR
ncbi:MAG: MFS transporter [Firmicutes bacterium]|nr:MFS transporter [Bacillota bacterium]